MRAALTYKRSTAVYTGVALDKRSITIIVPIELWQRIDQLARRLKFPLAQAARKLLEKAVEQE